MNKLKSKDNSSIKDGINNSTYHLLFGDYNNLPKEEQGSYENVIAYITIDCFTKFQEKKIFIKLLKLFSQNSVIDLNYI